MDIQEFSYFKIVALNFLLAKIDIVIPKNLIFLLKYGTGGSLYLESFHCLKYTNTERNEKWRKIYKHETMTQTVFIRDDSENVSALEIKYFYVP